MPKNFHAPRTESISTILFDWDGTIVDSAQLGLNAYYKVFAELECEFSEEIYNANYSPNWDKTYEALGLPREHWAKADTLWRFHYDQQAPQLIEGAADTLAKMHANGYRLGIVSSGNDDRVNREIDQFGLRDLFEVVMCHEHITQRKPHPEGLHLALARMTVSPNEVAYVGDAPEDIQMGKEARVLTVAVHSNYPCNARLLIAEPDIYLQSIGELLNYFPSVSKRIL
ncbi:MAG TPA: HAD family hydrolase [Pyrinomonadaceae bacterium]|nr:HAD family hydrolase [Pyrinomonadaceae bacterium]